jgi:hypothetical protein
MVIARLVILMMVNSWGYDVVQYDADAIILENCLSGIHSVMWWLLELWDFLWS